MIYVIRVSTYIGWGKFPSNVLNTQRVIKGYHLNDRTNLSIFYPVKLNGI